MAKITRYTGDLQAFASDSLGTERTIFGDVTQADDLDSNINTDFLRGWGTVGVNENPTKQDFNALGYTATQLLSYLHQMGMAEWDGAQEYQINSFVNRGGVIYRCLTADHVSATAPESDATNWDVLVDAPSGAINITVFSTSGTYNKPAGLRHVEVTVIGGGGAGGRGGASENAGGGGAGGASIKAIAEASLGASETITIGAGASSTTVNGAGGNGGSSSFGAHCSATGGLGGSGDNTQISIGGLGGAGSGGDINLTGGGGITGAEGSSDAGQAGGAGGCSIFGGGGAGGGHASGSGVSGTNGGGGAGAPGNSGDGGAGGDGIIVIKEYF